jgi:histidinol-phosphatase (PHP family)
MLANYHTHCSFDHGAGSPEEYVQAALARGLRALGFSCHAPAPYPTDWNMPEERVADYLREIERLKKAYQGRIEIYTGMEIDYFPGDRRQIFTKYPLDYRIGSVHSVADPVSGRYFGIDNTDAEFREALDLCCAGDIRALAAEYYGLVRRMLREESPEIIGHFDLIKKMNRDGRYFAEESAWYRDLAYEALRDAAAAGAILEVNTGGLNRGSTAEYYPSPWILAEACRLGIPVHFGSDAHDPAHLDGYYPKAVAGMNAAGYTGQRLLLGSQWVEVDLGD